MPSTRSTEPFAWALIRPDGADTAMLGAVEAGSLDAMSHRACGSSPCGPTSAKGHIHDLAHWKAVGRWLTDSPRSPSPSACRDVEPVRSVRTPAELVYTYTPGDASSRFLKGIAEKKILGERAEPGARVYVPPRGADPQLGKPTIEQVEVAHTGTVTSFCVVNVSFYGGTHGDART